MFTHDDIWDAIDALAKSKGLSPSGLAKKAGLSSTLFNPSKRENNKRKRWPSTESIAAILDTTNTTLDAFFALLAKKTDHKPDVMPFLSMKEASNHSLYEKKTRLPMREMWDEIKTPLVLSPDAFALQTPGKSFGSSYPEGTIIILDPREKFRRGDKIAVMTISAEIVIRVLGREGAQKIELLPFGTEGAPLTLSRSDVHWMHRIVWTSQ